MIVSLDVFREEDENRQRCFIMFFSSTAEMIVTWGHSRTLWDLSLEKSIPPLISVFCGAVITAVKWRFIRGERVVAVGLSWDKATAGQVRSTSLSTITNTQIGLSKSVHLRLHGGKGWHAALQPPLVHSPSFVLPFVFLMGNKFWVLKVTVHFIVQWILI